MLPEKSPPLLQKLLLHWFDQHGRKHLPWQQNKNPYRVWVSEVMLQQTQVNTVIPYFERFMMYFPDLTALAHAPLDSVLHLWSGLGYYSRARNLHRAAQHIQKTHAGTFPATLAELMELPGIGRSTAGAILAMAFNQKATILDGNVKRVLTRLLGITTWPGEKNTENQLWEYAQRLTPTQRAADYTQAIMDLGATLCTRTKPHCKLCPFTEHCRAHQQGIVDMLPKKKPTQRIPMRTATLLVVKKNRAILLQKRPAQGIWGGLWSLPEISGEASLTTIRDYCWQELHLDITDCHYAERFRHTFSHFHLDILPAILTVEKPQRKKMSPQKYIWYKLDNPTEVGLPAPVSTLLRTFHDTMG